MDTEEKTREQLDRELAEARRDLKEHELRMGYLLASIPQKLFFKDRDSVYLLCNESYARDLGIRPSEIVGRTDYDFYSRELADTYREGDRRVMEAGRPEDLEERYVMEGKEFIVRTYKNPVADDQGRPVGLVGIFDDITGYKATEREAERRNRVLEAVNQVFEEAITTDSEEALARRCLAIAEELTNSRFGFLGENHPHGRYDTIALSDPGWETCRMPESQAAILINNMEIRGLWGQVIKENRGLYTNDPMNHPRSVGLPEGHPPLTAFLGVPLWQGRKVIGMIAVGNKEGGYDDSDLRALRGLSSAIGQALSGKRAELARVEAANIIAQQSQEIMELSTPVIQVWEGIVAAPLIGTLDSQRTQQFMERFLEAIVEAKAPVAMVDITGVPTVDTQTAQHLIEAITAARLLGTRVILTGVRPAIAQTLVHLGIDLSEIETQSSLMAGLKLALNMLGLAVTKR